MSATKPKGPARQIDETVARCGAEKSRRIDLGLAILEVITPPGVPLSQAEISVYCGCTSEAIRMIEFRALRKVRRRLGAERMAEALQHMVERSNIPEAL